MSVVAAVVLQDCGDDMLGCALIRCDTGAMVDKDDSVIIQIRSRVYTNTLILVGLARSHARTPCKHSTRFIVIIMTVMVVSPLAASYGDRAGTDAGTVADMAATRKTKKYSAYRFEPIAAENLGVFSSTTLNFISELGRRICFLSSKV